MVARQTDRASGRVHEVLRRQILSGELAPGEAVPSERLLAEQLEVHRQSVREALKRLEQTRREAVAHRSAQPLRAVATPST